MAVTLIQQPPAFTFSGNFIPVKFQTDNYLEQEGRKAVNRVLFPLSSGGLQVVTIAADTVVSIRYGATVVAMTAVDGAPDDSGTQFPAGTYSPNLSFLVPYFQANYTLSGDFDISYSGRAAVEFTAKRFGRAYEFHSQSSSEWATDYVVGSQQEIPRPNYGIHFELHVEREDQSGFDIAYSNVLPVGFGFPKVASIDLSDTLHTILHNAGYDMPGLSATTPVACNKTCRRYFFQYAEAYGQPRQIRRLNQSDMFTVLLGKLSYVGAIEKTVSGLLQPVPGDPVQDRFLKQSQGDIRPVIRTSQPQFLYFYNTRLSAEGARYKAKYYFTTGGSAEEIISVFDLLQFRKYAFNARLDKIYNPANHGNQAVERYEVWLESSSGTRISELCSFTLDYSHEQYLRYFLYLDSWGAMQCLRTTGQAQSEYDLTQQTSARIRREGYALADGDTTVFDIRTTDKYKVASGWMTNDELIMTRDFVLSAKKFRFYKGRLLPISLTSNTIAEKDDANRLYKQQFEYEYLYQDDAFTERTDNDVEPVDTNPPRIALVYYGASASLPESEADLKALQSQPESIFEWTLHTGTQYRFFTVAVPYWKALHLVLDDKAEEILTGEYVKRSLTVDGEEYYSYTMQIAVPYASDHRHQVTIKNIDLPGLPPDPEELLVYFGGSSTAPVTAAAIKALSSQSGAIQSFIAETGTNRVFTIALPFGLVLSEVYDQVAEEVLTGEFIPAALSIDGNPYTVYRMQMAIPYSVSHNYEISIQHG